MTYVAHFNQKTIEPMPADAVQLGVSRGAPAHAQEPLHLVGRTLVASRCLANSPRLTGAVSRPSLSTAKSDQGVVGSRQLVRGAIRRQENRQRPDLRHVCCYCGSPVAAIRFRATTDEPQDRPKPVGSNQRSRTVLGRPRTGRFLSCGFSARFN